MKKKITVIVLFVTLVGSVFAQSDLQPIAQVTLYKRSPITLGQLKERVSAYERELGRKFTIAERQQALDIIVNETLFYQAAQKEGVSVSDAQVNASFSQIIARKVRRPISEAEFAELIRKQTGMSLDDYMKRQNGMTVKQSKDFLRRQLMIQSYIQKTHGKDIQKRPVPSDKEIRTEYELNKQSLVRPDTAKIFLVAVQKSDSKAKSKINALRARIKKSSKEIPKIRAEALKAKPVFIAQDAHISKTKLAAEQLGVPMEKVVSIFSMRKNEVSGISETPNTYQFFVFQEKYDAKLLALSDEYQPGTTVTVYEYIKQGLAQRKYEQLFAQILAEAQKDLRKTSNFKMLKTRAQLNKILSW